MLQTVYIKLELTQDELLGIKSIKDELSLKTNTKLFKYLCQNHFVIKQQIIDLNNKLQSKQIMINHLQSQI